MTRLLDLLAPYLKGYVPYVKEQKIDLRRTYLKGAILGLIVGFLLGFGVSVYWQAKASDAMDRYHRETSFYRQKENGIYSARKEALGDEISKRTMAENKLRKMGVMK